MGIHVMQHMYVINLSTDTPNVVFTQPGMNTPFELRPAVNAKFEHETTWVCVKGNGFTSSDGIGGTQPFRVLAATFMREKNV